MQTVLLTTAILGIWILACRIASRDWQILQAEYPAAGRPPGEKWRPTLRIGRTTYDMIVAVISDDGLYLHPGLIPPVLFHRAVLIPWAAITRQDKARWPTSIDLTVTTSQEPMRVNIRGAVCNVIAKRLAGADTQQPAIPGS